MKKAYNTNIKHLNSILGLKINSALQEQYFFEGKLDEKSLGTLKLEFSNGVELTFSCDGDAESLSIQLGGFRDKGTIETDYDDNRYKWNVRDYLTRNKLSEYGKVKDCQVEIFSNQFGTIQSGCRIIFENEDSLNIWTIESDNIFYGINETPPYYKKETLKIELLDIKTLFNNSACYTTNTCS